MTDHSDIVERLEDYAEDDYYFDHKGSLVTTNRPIALREASAEITRLRAEAEALRKDKVMLREALVAICDELLDDDAFSATQIARHAGRAALAATTESETKEQQA